MYPIGRPVRATITLYPIGRPVRATITLYPIGRPFRATITLYPIRRPVKAIITLYYHIVYRENHSVFGKEHYMKAGDVRRYLYRITPKNTPPTQPNAKVRINPSV